MLSLYPKAQSQYIRCLYPLGTLPSKCVYLKTLGNNTAEDIGMTSKLNTCLRSAVFAKQIYQYKRFPLQSGGWNAVDCKELQVAHAHLKRHNMQIKFISTSNEHLK